jgi:hypothetical protein
MKNLNKLDQKSKQKYKTPIFNKIQIFSRAQKKWSYQKLDRVHWPFWKREISNSLMEIGEMEWRKNIIFLLFIQSAFSFFSYKMGLL